MNVSSAINRGIIRTAFLAGGFSDRLDAIADSKRNKYPIAKPACPVGNMRLVDFQLRAAYEAGLREFNFLVRHLPKSIEQVVNLSIGNGIYSGSRARFIHEGNEPLDTAGAVAKFVVEKGWGKNEEDIIIIPSADIIHNQDLATVLDMHLRNTKDHGAVGTIVVNPVDWKEVDRLGTVRLEGMVSREECENGSAEFEQRIDEWLGINQGKSVKILKFREKKSRSSANHEESCLSNINNSSTYIFNAGFFGTIIPMMTTKKGDPLFNERYQPGGPTPFSDWGRHIFKWLTENNQINLFPLYAYIMENNRFWRDAGTGESLREGNMSVLDGKIYTGLDDIRFWTRESWGWRGKNVYIHPNAEISPFYKSIIGDNVVIEKGVKIVHSVIRENNIIREGVQAFGSVFFPKPYDKPDSNEIGPRSKIIDSILLGGNLEPDSIVERQMRYSPVAGMAKGSMLGKTKFDVNE